MYLRKHLRLFLTLFVMQAQNGWSTEPIFLNFDSEFCLDNLGYEYDTIISIHPHEEVEFITFSDASKFNIKFPKNGKNPSVKEVEFITFSDASKKFNIKFPKNGKQPTTKDAAIWSCANSKDPSVTEWYIHMLGGGACSKISFPKLFPQQALKAIHPLKRPLFKTPYPLKMGFDLPLDITKDKRKQKAIPIIQCCKKQSDFQAEEGIIMGDTEEHFFWETFRQIAENPIGRVLLYRILIEIRRQDASGEGCTEFNSESPESKIQRNNARSLRILQLNWDNWTYQYAIGPDEIAPIQSPGIICCYLAKENRANVTLVHKDENDQYYTQHTREENDSTYFQTSLFHEMLHWYQQLRAPERCIQESNIPLENLNQPSLFDIYAYSPPIPYLSWGCDPLCLLAGELRVICGRSLESSTDYLEGDDLSENALRCSLNTYMRFGHGVAIPLAKLVTQPAVQLASNTAITCVSEITNISKDIL